MRKYLILGVLGMFVMAIALPGCSAWRTITTTATCTQSTDSTQSTTTIVTKTVEEYTGIKK